MKAFSPGFQCELSDLMRWRRDVRRFRTEPVDGCLIDECLAAARLAPSVGLSEPWRFLMVRSQSAREAARRNFETENAKALGGYDGDQAALYSGLKLSGMQEAPVQIAVFCDDATDKGARLGARSMPEMRRYSVVAAVMNLWLAARARGIGVGWVSILDPDQMARDLDAAQGWRLIAYLCLGWPEEAHLDPELERAGWERRSTDGCVEER